MSQDLKVLDVASGRRSIQLERSYEKKLSMMPMLGIAGFATVLSMGIGLIKIYELSNLPAAAVGVGIGVGFSVPALVYSELVKNTYRTHYEAALKHRCLDMVAANPHVTRKEIAAWCAAQRAERAPHA